MLQRTPATLTAGLAFRRSVELRMKLPWDTSYATGKTLQAQKPASRLTFPRTLQSPTGVWVGIDVSFADLHDPSTQPPTDPHRTLEELWDEALSFDNTTHTGTTKDQDASSGDPTDDSSRSDGSRILARAAVQAPEKSKQAVIATLIKMTDDFALLKPRGNLPETPRYEDDLGLVAHRRMFFALRQRFLDAAPLLFPPASLCGTLSVTHEMLRDLVGLTTSFVSVYRAAFGARWATPKPWDTRRSVEFLPLNIRAIVESLFAQFERAFDSLPVDDELVRIIIGCIGLGRTYDVPLPTAINTPAILKNCVAGCATRLPPDDALRLLLVLPDSLFCPTDTGAAVGDDTVELVRLLVACCCKSGMAEFTVEDVTLFLEALCHVCTMVPTVAEAPAAGAEGVTGAALLGKIVIVGANALLRRYVVILSHGPKNDAEVIVPEGGIIPLQQHLKVNEMKPLAGKHPPRFANETMLLTQAEGMVRTAVSARNGARFLRLINQLEALMGRRWRPMSLNRIRSETAARIAASVTRDQTQVSDALDALMAVTKSRIRSGTIAKLKRADVEPWSVAEDGANADALLNAIDSALANRTAGGALPLQEVISGMQLFAEIDYKGKNMHLIFLQLQRFHDLELSHISIAVRSMIALNCASTMHVVAPHLVTQVERRLAQSTPLLMGSSEALTDVLHIALGFAAVKSPLAMRVLLATTEAVLPSLGTALVTTPDTELLLIEVIFASIALLKRSAIRFGDPQRTRLLEALTAICLAFPPPSNVHSDAGDATAAAALVGAVLVCRTASQGPQTALREKIEQMAEALLPTVETQRVDRIAYAGLLQLATCTSWLVKESYRVPRLHAELVKVLQKRLSSCGGVDDSIDVHAAHSAMDFLESPDALIARPELIEVCVATVKQYVTTQQSNSASAAEDGPMPSARVECICPGVSPQLNRQIAEEVASREAPETDLARRLGRVMELARYSVLAETAAAAAAAVN